MSQPEIELEICRNCGHAKSLHRTYYTHPPIDKTWTKCSGVYPIRDRGLMVGEKACVCNTYERVDPSLLGRMGFEL